MARKKALKPLPPIEEIEERLLAKASEDPTYFDECIRHARDVRRGAWPDFERLLLEYAKDYEECEPAVSYVLQVTRERLTDLEPLLISDWDAIRKYMRLLPARDHWDYLVDVVLNDTSVAAIDRAFAILLICQHWRRGRWEEAEPLMIESAKHDGHSMGMAVEYAKEFHGGHWQDLEDAVLAGLCDPRATARYTTLVHNGPWEELEDAIFARPEEDNWAQRTVVEYAAAVMRPRWVKGERYLQSARLLHAYAKLVVRGRLPPELHDKMATFHVLGDTAEHNDTEAYYKEYGL